MKATQSYVVVGIPYAVQCDPETLAGPFAHAETAGEAQRILIAHGHRAWVYTTREWAAMRRDRIARVVHTERPT